MWHVKGKFRSFKYNFIGKHWNIQKWPWITFSFMVMRLKQQIVRRPRWNKVKTEGQVRMNRSIPLSTRAAERLGSQDETKYIDNCSLITCQRMHVAPAVDLDHKRTTDRVLPEEKRATKCKKVNHFSLVLSFRWPETAKPWTYAIKPRLHNN